jgi:hypothetical protein
MLASATKVLDGSNVIAMTDTIKVVSWGPDPQSGGEAINIEVHYSDGRKAAIVLKPGRLPSIGNHLREELDQLAKVLQQAPISQAASKFKSRDHLRCLPCSANLVKNSKV